VHAATLDGSVAKKYRNSLHGSVASSFHILLHFNVNWTTRGLPTRGLPTRGLDICCCRCLLLWVQSELDIIAKHHAELKCGVLCVILNSLKITVVWDRSVCSSLYIWLFDTWLWSAELYIHAFTMLHKLADLSSRGLDNLRIGECTSHLPQYYYKSYTPVLLFRYVMKPAKYSDKE